MKQMKRLLIILIFLGLQSCVFSIENEEISSTQKNKELQNNQQETKLIKDFEDIFTEPQERELNKIVNDYRIKTNREICIITTESLAEFQSADEFALNAFNVYDVGGEEEQLGLIIIVSQTLRELTISAGREAKKQILDEEIAEIYSQELKTNFKENNFYKGTKNAIEGVINFW
jgi:uncharacterized membrane protein YgcG